MAGPRTGQLTRTHQTRDPNPSQNQRSIHAKLTLEFSKSKRIIGCLARFGAVWEKAWGNTCAKEQPNFKRIATGTYPDENLSEDSLSRSCRKTIERKQWKRSKRRKTEGRVQGKMQNKMEAGDGCIYAGRPTATCGYIGPIVPSVFGRAAFLERPAKWIVGLPNSTVAATCSRIR